MIGSWEIDRLDSSGQLFAFSRSYLKSSAALCSRLQRLRRKPRYPEATVVLFLARHSVELFLKGAIIARSRNTKLHHDLAKLKSKYDRLYRDSKFAWSLPFGTEYPGLTPQQITEAKKHIPPADQLYRYPIDKSGVKWSGVFALDPLSFQRELQRLGKEMTGLARKISTANMTLSA